MRSLQPQAGRNRQAGAVLITALIFLVVLTMFVLAMVRGGTLEERMARNARDQQTALESAEAVLRDAENSLFIAAPFDPYDSSKFTAECANGLCYRPGASYDWRTIDWDSDTLTRSFASAGSQLGSLGEQPRYIVEIVSAPFKASSAGQCEVGLARITARGRGNNGATAFVQSTVRFRVFTNICD
ncbi:MAG: pilus assembly PilX family protein [Telluria sp.]